MARTERDARTDLGGLRAANQRDRAAPPVKRPLHAGRTQKDAGYSPYELDRLAAGCCEGLADQTERGERIAHGLLIVCGAIVILGVVGKALGWW